MTPYPACPPVALRVPFVDLGAQQRSVAPELEGVARSMLQRTDRILGPELETFEREFAALCEAEHAVGTDCGLSALELILRAAGIGRRRGRHHRQHVHRDGARDLAHRRLAGPGRRRSADGQHRSCRAAARIGPQTKAVVAVHLYGQPADMDAVRRIADRHGLLVVEDACQAHGARYRGRRASSLGDAAAFSFYPSKNLGAFGDGGAVVTSDDGLADAVRVLRNYGQRRKHEHVVKGYNNRLDTLQAALLRVKLRHLDEWNARRRGTRRPTPSFSTGRP